MIFDLPEGHSLVIVLNQTSFLRLEIDNAGVAVLVLEDLGDTASVGLGRILGGEDFINRCHCELLFDLRRPNDKKNQDDRMAELRSRPEPWGCNVASLLTLRGSPFLFVHFFFG